MAIDTRQPRKFGMDAARDAATRASAAAVLLAIGYGEADGTALDILAELLALRLSSLLAAASRLSEHACRARLGPFDVLEALALVSGASSAPTTTALLRMARRTAPDMPRPPRGAPLNAPGRALLRSAEDRSSDDEDEDDGAASLQPQLQAQMRVPQTHLPNMGGQTHLPNMGAQTHLPNAAAHGGLGMIPPPFGARHSAAASPAVSPHLASAVPRFLASGTSSAVVSPTGLSPTLPHASFPASAPTSPVLAAPPSALGSVPSMAALMGPAAAASVTTSRVRAERAARPAYMPDMYPPLPRPYTFRWTETRGVRETDAVVLAKARAEQQRQIEAALAALRGRRIADGVAFNYEDALFCD